MLIQLPKEQLSLVVTQCLFHALITSDYAQLRPEDAIILQFCAALAMWHHGIFVYSIALQSDYTLLLQIFLLLNSLICSSQDKVLSKINLSKLVCSDQPGCYYRFGSTSSKDSGHCLFSGLKTEQQYFWGSKFTVSLFALTQSCSDSGSEMTVIFSVLISIPLKK